MNANEQLPVTMDALVWTAPRRMEMQRVPVPRPGAGEILLEVGAVGICGSELSGYLGQNSLRVPPLVMGHEVSGRIVQMGDDLPAGAHSLALGQRVAVNPIIGCGDCPQCEASMPNLCQRRRIIGAHCAGGFAQYVAVPAAQCSPLSTNLRDEAGALAEPLACSARAVHHARWQQDSALLILGAGTIGLFCLAVARAEGNGAIVISDMLDARLDVARAWGATYAVNGRAADAKEQLRAAMPGGAACVIDAVGSDATRALALQLVRPGGRVVYIGLHDESSPLAANYLVRQEIAVQGSFAYTPADFAHALDLLERGVITPGPTWTEERPLAGGAAAFAGLLDGTIATPKIILRP